MDEPAVPDVPVDAAFVPRRAPSTYTVEVEGEAVILDEAADRLHLLNRSASLLWACFDGESSLAEICADVADAVEAAPEAVLADSLEVVRHLCDEGLLEDARG